MGANAIVYVDGSGVRGPGGWGFTASYNGKSIELAGAETHATNNRMELMAPIMALSYFKPGTKLLIHSDSEYVVKGITIWIYSWLKQNLLPDPRYQKLYTYSPDHMTNADLWFELFKLTERHDVEWKWVPGHAGVEGNEKADRLAVEAMADLRAEASKNLALDILGYVLSPTPTNIILLPADENKGISKTATIAEYTIQFNNNGSFKGLLLNVDNEDAPFILSIQGAPDRSYKLFYSPSITDKLTPKHKSDIKNLKKFAKLRGVELMCRGCIEKDRKFYESIGLQPKGKRANSFIYIPT